MFGELSSDCINTFTKKTLIQGEFKHSQVKRKVLMLCLNFLEFKLGANTTLNAWQIPKVITHLVFLSFYLISFLRSQKLPKARANLLN